MLMPLTHATRTQIVYLEKQKFACSFQLPKHHVPKQHLNVQYHFNVSHAYSLFITSVSHSLAAQRKLQNYTKILHSILRNMSRTIMAHWNITRKLFVCNHETQMHGEISELLFSNSSITLTRCGHCSLHTMGIQVIEEHCSLQKKSEK
jgi:hypothetical protein